DVKDAAPENDLPVLAPTRGAPEDDLPVLAPTGDEPEAAPAAGDNLSALPRMREDPQSRPVEEAPPPPPNGGMLAPLLAILVVVIYLGLALAFRLNLIGEPPPKPLTLDFLEQPRGENRRPDPDGPKDPKPDPVVRKDPQPEPVRPLPFPARD